MNVLDFFASAIDSISWPIGIVILTLLLRKHLGKLLSHLARIRYGNLELGFEKLEGEARTAGLQPLAESARVETVPEKSKDVSFKDAIADAVQLAAEFPEAAVNVAWRAVERELMQAVERLVASTDYPLHNTAFRNISLLL